MVVPCVSDTKSSLRKATVEKYLRHGAPPPGEAPEGSNRGAVALAAAELKVSLYPWLRKVSGTIHEPDWSLWRPEAPSDEGFEERREIRDAAFWRRKAADLQRQLADAEHVAEELAGVRNQPIVIPPWLMARTEKGKPRKAVLGMLLSDIHLGEVISAEELNGINSYDVDICRRRLRRFFSAATEIGPRWLADSETLGVLLALGGDLVSGDIHEELRITNELQARAQVRVAVEELCAGITHLLAVFKRVHVASVPGNHGRTTIKDTAKLYSKLNYDSMVADMVEDRFHSDGRVTFQIGSSTDQIIPIFGWSVLLTHGHKSGTGGGQGFVGPDLPIVRGGKKIAAQQASVGRRIDLQLTAHRHHSTNPQGILSNGSIPGYSEYASDLRSVVDAPRQWLFVLHEKWCLRERADIQLEDPSPPEKPRVRVYV